VAEIAMESTGQYWRAVWNILEGHFEKLIFTESRGTSTTAMLFADDDAFSRQYFMSAL
jgi:hypothetical protein